MLLTVPFSLRRVYHACFKTLVSVQFLVFLSHLTVLFRCLNSALGHSSQKIWENIEENINKANKIQPYCHLGIISWHFSAFPFSYTIYMYRAYSILNIISKYWREFLLWSLHLPLILTFFQVIKMSTIFNGCKIFHLRKYSNIFNLLGI